MAATTDVTGGTVPSAPGGPLWAPALVETHASIVVFVGDRAYKLKKPLDLGFLDFTTPEARRAACHRETELNRRLAPDVYLGVADIVGADGTVCDHLVVMRRMPADRRLSTLVLADVPVDDHLRRVAHQLAALHARGERSAAANEAASVSATRARWRSNTNEMLAMEPAPFAQDLVEATQALADRYLDGRSQLFEQRIRAGRAVDGHGDLLCDDIFCLDDGPRILDCLEFDDRLRIGDGLADAAFLSMDLERLGRADLGASFLEQYRELGGDAWPASLAHHHVAYRAQVRAKVTAIRSAQGDTAASAEAAALLDLTMAHLDAGRVRLVLVGGLPGTGKSTLAAALGHELSATVLRSDELRKQLAGIPTLEPAPADFEVGIYGPATTAATYEVLLRRAEVALGLGESVVLDASWTSAAWRTRARSVAAAASAELTELRCDAPVEVTLQRLAERARAGRDPSDATPTIAAVMASITDPWPEATTIDTRDDRATSVAAALRYLRSRSSLGPREANRSGR